MKEVQNILITGANGYLGAQLSQHLALSGHRITALCYPEAPRNSEWNELMEEVIVGSVADRAIIDELEKHSFDIIIHLVSMDQHQSQSVPPEMVTDVNVRPCWMLLAAFSKRGLKKFIYFSTIHVYGTIPAISITENQPTNPGNVYALTHILCEKICDYYNHTTNVNCITVRLSNSYGHPVFPENNCWWLAVNDLCRSAYMKKSIKLLSDGSPQRDFIHGSDVCSAVELLCEKATKTIDRNIYHISSSHTYTLLELAGLVKEVYEELYGSEIPVLTPTDSSVSDFSRFSGQARYKIDHSALQSLGFEPKCDMKEGIRRLFIYFEKNTQHA
jgi:Nucleoside-diphosphate-sugar epimerases